MNQPEPTKEHDSCGNPAPLRFWPAFNRSCRLRCPRCGESKLYASYFNMKSECEQCQLDIAREPGFYLGAIYFNYGLTTLLALTVFFSLYFGYGISPDTQLWPLAAFAVIFPLLFFRHARALWLGMDVWLDKSQQKR